MKLPNRKQILILFSDFLLLLVLSHFWSLALLATGKELISFREFLEIGFPYILCLLVLSCATGFLCVAFKNKEIVE